MKNIYPNLSDYEKYFSEFHLIDKQQQDWRNENGYEYYEFNFEMRMNRFSDREFMVIFVSNGELENLAVNRPYDCLCDNYYQSIVELYLRKMRKELNRLQEYGINYLEIIPKLRKAKNLERRLLNQKNYNKKQKVNKI